MHIVSKDVVTGEVDSPMTISATELFCIYDACIWAFTGESVAAGCLVYVANVVRLDAYVYDSAMLYTRRYYLVLGRGKIPIVVKKVKLYF